MYNNIALGIIIILLFVSLIVLFFALVIKLYINKVKKFTKLIYQKDIEFQKSLNQTIIETQEQVFKNIGEELHDDAGQQISVINFQIEGLKYGVSIENEQLVSLKQSIDTLSGTIRSLSHSLNNQILLQQDIVKAINSEVLRIQKNRSIEFILRLDNSSERAFETNQHIILYRIFQETINNVLKHAKASLVTIEVITMPKFKMTIADNGRGFDHEFKKNYSETLGLNNIYNKAKIINFEATIYSKPNQGTIITISEP